MSGFTVDPERSGSGTRGAALLLEDRATRFVAPEPDVAGRGAVPDEDG